LASFDLNDNTDYDSFEELFDPTLHDRQERRKRKTKQNHKPKKSQSDVLQAIADTDGMEAGFKTTYIPGPFEQGWLLDALKGFYDAALITDVLGRVKGGKEASVYRCEGHPSTNQPLLAAKVYRPRMFRNLSNDQMYREGRVVLKEDGRAAKATDTRLMRAMGKKTAFGQQAAHTSWLMHEFKTLQRLYQMGASVPEPIGSTENAILMSYHGDATRGAPTLNETTLNPKEAKPLFDEVMRNIELMLRHGLIHGDLSAYNILYWEGEIVLIDFPQVTDSARNGNAQFILQRDIERVCEYFEQYGVRTHPRGIFRQLWQTYAAPDANTIAADMSRFEVDEA
jgi:RIO kinase 1